MVEVGPLHQTISSFAFRLMSAAATSEVSVVRKLEEERVAKAHTVLFRQVERIHEAG